MMTSVDCYRLYVCPCPNRLQCLLIVRAPTSPRSASHIVSGEHMQQKILATHLRALISVDADPTAQRKPMEMRTGFSGAWCDHGPVCLTE